MRPHDVHTSGIELCLQLRRIIFFNHLDVWPAVPGNLIDGGTFQQAQQMYVWRRLYPVRGLRAMLLFPKNCIE